MKIQVILGSTRPGRVGERVAKWVAAAAEKQTDFQVELVDLAEYDLPHFNEPISPRFNPNRQPSKGAQNWITKVGEADAYIFVTPEYNASFPGVLKDAIDYLDYQLAKKPVAIVSYGAVGGTRASVQLKSVLSTMTAVIPESVALAGPQAVLDEEGKFIGDSSNPYGPEKQLQRVLGELAWWAETLRAGRKQPAGVA